VGGRHRPGSGTSRKDTPLKEYTERRAERRRVVPGPTPDVREKLAALAARATLVPFAAATARTLDPATDVAVLHRAFNAGQVAGPWEDGFPRYVWYHSDAVNSTESTGSTSVTEFRLTGARPGEYAGYRLPPSYRPEGLR